MPNSDRLAIDGGRPVCPEPIPTSPHGAAEIGEPEKQAVLRVLEKRRVFRFLQEGIEGSETAALEARYAERLGVRHTLAVNSGTSALIAGLAGIALEPGDEVVIPAYTFIATAAAVLAVRAIPVLCEVDASLTMDPEDLCRCITPRTRAVIPVHMRGFPCRMREILSIAKEHNLVVVEDVAQANGATYRGTPLGALGEVGCFSFQHYKIITSGEGGLVATNDEKVFSRARTQHDCASRYWLNTQEEIYDVYGEDYRMSELAAALVLAQMDRLDGLLRRFRSCKQRIADGLAGIDGIQLAPSADPEGDAGIAVVFYTENAELSRRFAQALEAEGVSCGTIYNRGIPDRHIYCYWPFVNRHPTEGKVCPWTCGCTTAAVRYSPDMCPKTLDYLGRAISLHIHQRLTDTHCDRMVEAARKVARALA
jgi:8-amino-3,8-dideoxy-alpha-D-manno-octulosonate transaminase